MQTCRIARRPLALAAGLLLAACSGLPSAPAPVLEPTASTYQITLRFSGSFTSAQKTVFRNAAARWSQAVTGDLANLSFSKPANDCGAGEPAFSGTVDDLLIDAQSVAIDGPGGILGRAGPCYIRTSNDLTLYGVMQFDRADLAALQRSGQLQNVIVHEMGHVIGHGTLWELKGLLAGASTNNPTFRGAKAKRAYAALGKTGNVPVENTGGAGTRNSHWRESVFKNELMTGYLNTGTNPLSRVSIAGLGDLGYVVNQNAADPFSLSALAGQSVRPIEGKTVVLKLPLKRVGP